MIKRSVFERVCSLFYIVDPAKSTFETVEEVPDYTKEAIPIFLILFYTEQFILWLKRKQIPTFNDSLASAYQGLFVDLIRIFFRWWYTVFYIYVYNNWRVFDLPLKSPWTWWIGFIGVDFVYYWAHRASHEINILWAVHQIHHSSEEYNLSTSLRLSVFQELVLTIFYLPIALVVPPPIYLTHNELNLLFQFWLHTELIGSLGPLEYVFNTASHHRVHHGRNRNCVNKNFGGVVIIWDRIFGTFEPEGETKIAYGVTPPINTFEPIYIQSSHFAHIFKTFWKTPGLRNKLSVIFKGPGWTPGSPWHGRLEDFPDIKAPIEKYNPAIPLWCQLYTILQTFIQLIGILALSTLHHDLPARISYLIAIFIVLSLSILGMLNDGRSYAPWLELIRCASFLLIDFYFFPMTALISNPSTHHSIAVVLIRATFIVSLIGWIKVIIPRVSVNLLSRKKVD